MTIELTVADLADVVDLDLGVGEWREITQRQVDRFADATDDHQWIHVDPERAAAGPFGGPIAHGFLTLSLVPGLLKELLTVTDGQRGINYGLETVRFTAPVPVGSRIRMRARIARADRRDDGSVRYRVAVTIEIEGQERPAMVGESLLLVYP